MKITFYITSLIQKYQLEGRQIIFSAIGDWVATDFEKSIVLSEEEAFELDKLCEGYTLIVYERWDDGEEIHLIDLAGITTSPKITYNRLLEDCCED